MLCSVFLFSESGEDMEQWDKEYFLSRIIAGQSRFKLFDKVFTVTHPSRIQRYISNEVYQDVYQECKLNDIMVCDELLLFARDKGLWGDDQDKELETLNKNVEDLKVGLYERFSEDNARFSIKKGLDLTNKEINRLFNLKNKFDYLSCESIATAAKLRYLIGVAINYPNYDVPGEYTEDIMNRYFYEKIPEEKFREISRTEPWLSYWTTKGYSGNGLFGVASVDLNEEQRTLMMWSSFYESIKEHPECPNEKILADNDALDGWIIVQKRKRKEEQAKNRLDSVGAKVKGSDEVFLMAKSDDDYNDIMSLNNNEGKRIINQRWKYITENKEVKEGHLPDTIQKLQMQCARLEGEKMRSRR